MSLDQFNKFIDEEIIDHKYKQNCHYKIDQKKNPMLVIIFITFLIITIELLIFYLLYQKKKK